MHANCFTKRLVVSPAPAVKPRVPPVPCKKRTALQLIKAGGQCTGPSVLAPRRKNRTKVCKTEQRYRPILVPACQLVSGTTVRG